MCVAGSAHGGVCVCVWQGVCVEGGRGGGGMHGKGGVRDAKNSNCSGRYASYWNAFLFGVEVFASHLLALWILMVRLHLPVSRQRHRHQ